MQTKLWSDMIIFCKHNYACQSLRSLKGILSLLNYVCSNITTLASVWLLHKASWAYRHNVNEQMFTYM